MFLSYDNKFQTLTHINQFPLSTPSQSLSGVLTRGVKDENFVIRIPDNPEIKLLTSRKCCRQFRKFPFFNLTLTLCNDDNPSE